jgi:hypothetical protein
MGLMYTSLVTPNRFAWYPSCRPPRLYQSKACIDVRALMPTLPSFFFFFSLCKNTATFAPFAVVTLILSQQGHLHDRLTHQDTHTHTHTIPLERKREYIAKSINSKTPLVAPQPMLLHGCVVTFEIPCIHQEMQQVPSPACRRDTKGEKEKIPADGSKGNFRPFFYPRERARGRKKIPIKEEDTRCVLVFFFPVPSVWHGGWESRIVVNLRRAPSFRV